MSTGPLLPASPPISREYPIQPIVGVGGIVLAGDAVLLVRRGRAPMLGQWSLPGGALELGETMAEGVRREVFEETAMRVEPVEITATLDRIVRDAEGRVQFHYVLVDWLCVPETSAPGPVQHGDDALAAAWVPCRYLPQYNLSGPTLDLIRKAQHALAKRSMQ